MKKKLSKLTITIIFLSFMASCSFVKRNYKSSQLDQKTLTFADSLWIEYAIALENNNIEYLISNSLDTIQCGDCQIDSDSESEYFESESIFKDHLDKIMHLPTLLDREFVTYQYDNLIRVLYSVECRNAPEGAYDLIFTFIYTNHRYLFSGMIVT